MNILIVDDSRDLADSLAAMLEDEGHTATVAYSGEEAIKNFKQDSFDLTLMDVKLPGIDGLEAFSQIRELESDARVIIMTGYRIDQLLGLVVDDGTVKVLRKPFTLHDVSKSLDAVKPAGIVLVTDSDADFSAQLITFLQGKKNKILLVDQRLDKFDSALCGDLDVLVLDLGSSIVQGLDVYSTLKKEGCRVPTIMFARRDSTEPTGVDPLKAMSVTGCFFKPFHIDELLTIVQQDDLTS